MTKLRLPILTKEQSNFIDNNYATCSINEMAKLTGASYDKVWKYCKVKRLKAFADKNRRGVKVATKVVSPVEKGLFNWSIYNGDAILGFKIH